MGKIRSCAGCVGLVKVTNIANPYVYCSGCFEVEQALKPVYDKRLDFDVNIKPLIDCKCRSTLKFCLMCINKQNLVTRD